MTTAPNGPDPSPLAVEHADHMAIIRALRAAGAKEATLAEVIPSPSAAADRDDLPVALARVAGALADVFITLDVLAGKRVHPEDKTVEQRRAVRAYSLIHDAIDILAGRRDLQERCPDSGHCHHGCRLGTCDRVRAAGPLSGVFPANRWPMEVLREFAPDLIPAREAELLGALAGDRTADARDRLTGHFINAGIALTVAREAVAGMSEDAVIGLVLDLDART